MREPSTSQYTVRSGDTLSRIAQREYGDVSIARFLAQSNYIQNPNLIFVGKKLRLPNRENIQIAQAVDRFITNPPHFPIPTNRPSMGHQIAQGVAGFAREIGAIPVALPAFEIDLTKDIPKQVTYVPPYKITLAIKGEITIQPKGVLKGFTVKDLSKIEIQAKEEVRNGLQEMSSQMKVAFDPKKNSLELTGGFASAIKTPGGGSLVFKVDVGINQVKFVCETGPVKGRYKDLVFEGVMGFEVIVEREPDFGDRIREFFTVPAPSSDAILFFFTGLVVLTAAAIILAPGVIVGGAVVGGAAAFGAVLYMQQNAQENDGKVL